MTIVLFIVVVLDSARTVADGSYTLSLSLICSCYYGYETLLDYIILKKAIIVRILMAISINIALKYSIIYYLMA